MTLPGISRLLAHECFFGLFLAAMALRLSLSAGPFSLHALVYWALLGTLAALILRTEREESPVRWRVRLLFFPVAMNLCYVELGTGVPLLTGWRADSWLQRFDRAFAGANLSVAMESWISPPLTELLSFCYFLFIPYLFLSMARYFTGDLRVLKRFCAGLFTVYGIGFLGYAFLPASGPYIAMADAFRTPFDGWFMTTLNERMVLAGSNKVDVFPSLHCAVSSFILFFDRKHAPDRFRFYALPCVGLWLSTLYLRYHYLADLVAGFTLAAFALSIALRPSPEDSAP